MKWSDCCWKPSVSGKWVVEDIVGKDPGGGDVRLKIDICKNHVGKGMYPWEEENMRNREEVRGGREKRVDAN